MALPDVDSALYSQLSNDSNITALVSTRIYNMQVPSGVTMPYILFYLGNGAIENLTPTQSFNYVYRIECVAESRASAQSILAAVFTSLDGTALTISGFSNFFTVLEDTAQFIDNVAGSQRHRRVIDCRIRLGEN